MAAAEVVVPAVDTCFAHDHPTFEEQAHESCKTAAAAHAANTSDAADLGMLLVWHA